MTCFFSCAISYRFFFRARFASAAGFVSRRFPFFLKDAPSTLASFSFRLPSFTECVADMCCMVCRLPLFLLRSHQTRDLASRMNPISLVIFFLKILHDGHNGLHLFRNRPFGSPYSLPPTLFSLVFLRGLISSYIDSTQLFWISIDLDSIAFIGFYWALFVPT